MVEYEEKMMGWRERDWETQLHLGEGGEGGREGGREGRREGGREKRKEGRKERRMREGGRENRERDKIGEEDFGARATVHT